MPVAIFLALNIVVVGEPLQMLVDSSDVYTHLTAYFLGGDAGVHHNRRQYATRGLSTKTHHLTVIPPCVLVMYGCKLHFGGNLIGYQFCEIVEKMANLA